MKLKHTTLITLILCYYTPTLFAQYEGDQLFDDSYIHEIRITSDATLPELANIHLANIFSPDGSPYSFGLVTIDGVVLDTVGIRGKGGVTAFDDKTPLKIDFNRLFNSQRYDGLKKINLHGGYVDPSFMREIMSYHILRAVGLKSPRTSLTKVYFNDVYQGIYSIIEQVDDLFIDNRFASDKGALYKSFLDMDFIIKFEENNDLPYGDFLTIVESTPNSDLHLVLPDILDINPFIRYYIANVFIKAKDSFIDLNRNYYAYFDNRLGKYTYIPWDYNLSMFQGSSIGLVPSSSPNILADKFLKNDVLRLQYLDMYCKLRDSAFNEDRLQEKITQYYDLLVNEVDNDPILDMDSFEAAVAEVRDFIGIQHTLLDEQLFTYVNDCPSNETPVEQEDLVINEIMASNTGVAILDPNGEADDWIELYNNTDADINLKDFFLSNDIDVLKHWQFPDTIIEAQNYLIVWADRDVQQTGLHSSFKLNKTKGDVYLSHENGTIIDEVFFENQETNIAFARVPNGTGNFVPQQATFEADNTAVSTTTITTDFFVNIDPNPSSSNVMVQIKSDIYSGTSTLRLFNMYGQLLKEKVFNIHAGINTVSLNVSDIPADTFNIQVTDNQNNIKINSKLIVIH